MRLLPTPPAQAEPSAQSSETRPARFPLEGPTRGHGSWSFEHYILDRKNLQVKKKGLCAATRLRCSGCVSGASSSRLVLKISAFSPRMCCFGARVTAFGLQDKPCLSWLVSPVSFSHSHAHSIRNGRWLRGRGEPRETARHPEPKIPTN